jgi:hypothetical protein
MMVQGEDSGLCQGCGFIYDERLYEMRLRQHVANLPEGDLDEILSQVDPRYQEVIAK